jgi:hypothetical protein
MIVAVAHNPMQLDCKESLWQVACVSAPDGDDLRYGCGEVNGGIGGA